MTTYLRFSLLILSILALAACAPSGSIKPGGSTKAEVRASMGKPSDIRFSSDGGDIWEYATSPMGRQTYIVRFAKNGTVRDIDPVLDDRMFRQIKAKTSTESEVRDLLGMPADITFYTAGESWEYRTREPDGSPSTFNVRFGPDGVVEEAAKIVESYGGRSGRN